jgi:hypothetical protein
MSCCCSSAKGKLDIDPGVNENIITKPIRKIIMVRKKKSSLRTHCMRHYALCLFLGSRRASDLAIIFMDWRKGKDGALINVVDWTHKKEDRKEYEVISEVHLGQRVTILTLRDFYNKGASTLDNCRSSAHRMYDNAIRYQPVIVDNNGNTYDTLLESVAVSDGYETSLDISMAVEIKS